MKMNWMRLSKSVAVAAFMATALLALGCSEDNDCDEATYKPKCVDGRILKVCKDKKITNQACQTTEFCEETRCVNPNLKCNVNDETRCDDDSLGFSACVDNQLKKTACTGDEVCRIGKDKKPYCAPACENGRWDKGEIAVDCGGTCPACKECVKDSDCDSGFCDSAKGSVCSIRCKDAIDCKGSGAPLGDICRDDGRCGPEIFEAIWRVSGGDRTIILPHDGKGDCNFEVLWGDEDHKDFSKGTKVIDCKDLKKRTHTYKTDDNYRVKIRGIYKGFGHNTPDNEDCLQFCEGITPPAEIISFGNIGLAKGAFQCARNFTISSYDIPNPRLWSDASNLFRCTEGFNDSIETWDSSNLTNMSHIFCDAKDYKQTVNKIKTAKVTDLSGAFKNTPLFDQPLDAWDVSSVTTLSEAFAGSTKFNQDLSTWNTKSLKALDSVFENAETFNQPLAWNTAKVTTTAKAFKGAEAFNQVLSWDLSLVEDASEMFHSAKAFDQVLTAWKLKVGVILTDIVSESGLSKANYCALKAIEPWKEANIGELYSCD